MSTQDSPVTAGRATETNPWPPREYGLRYSQALWYAWGRQDAGDSLIGDAFKFADFYVERVRAFASGESRGFLAPVQECFAQWQGGA